MRRFLSVALSALVLATMAVAPPVPARASTADTDFNATAVMTVVNPGQFYSDPAGNRYYQGLVYTGPVTGWPINGSLRIDANISFDAGATTGQIDGSYVISDSSGSTFHGDLQESSVQESPNGLLIAARMNVEDGTGVFNDVHGSARIAGALPPLGPSAAAFAPPVYGQPYASGPYPPGYVGQAYPGYPFQVNPGQPTLAINGTLALNDAYRTSSFWSQNPNVRPGNGWGDDNHEHLGARSSNSDDDHHGNGNGRGRGRGHDKD